VKTLAWILTAAAVLIGADVFVMSSDPGTTETATIEEDAPVSLHGGSGMPTPPPDAY
jgi:hypothetical protein